MDDFYNEHFDVAYDNLENLCCNEKEKDAATDCLIYIKEQKQEYDFALSTFPKYHDRRKMDFDKAIANAGSEQEIEDIKLEWSSVKPLQSNVQYIKEDIWNWCNMLLQEANIGKKRRLEEFRPLIYNIITSSYCLKNSYEEDHDADILRQIKNLISTP